MLLLRVLFLYLLIGLEVNAKKIDLTTVLLYNFDNNTSTPHGRAIAFLDNSSQTFVSGGATTAYGTQVLGTRLENGHVLGQIFSTTSRVLYDSSKVGSPIDQLKDETENDILPTYTISNTFTPFTFEWNPQSTRSAKALSNGKLSSVTYFGFADFSTTVGDTVVFFRPSTTAVREIEPTEIEQIQPTRTLLQEITITPFVKVNEVTEINQNEEVKQVNQIEEVKEVNEIEEVKQVNDIKEVKQFDEIKEDKQVNEIKEVRLETQSPVFPEIKEEKQKTGKALFQEEPIVKVEEVEEKEEIVPVTESVSYEEDSEDDEEEEEEEMVTEEVKETESVAPIILESSVQEQNLIYSTLYTTVTYLTTLFDGEDSKVQSRVHVLSSSITPGLNITEADLLLDDDKNGRSLDFRRNDIEELNEDSFPKLAAPSVSEEDKDDALYTTFTYYTTVFGGNEKKILSRSEVVSNFINPSTVSKSEESSKEASSNNKEDADDEPQDFEDQISSESNLDEIPTLIQTSFTTFTFYTTMYVGDTSEIVSHLETVTRIISDTPAPVVETVSTTEVLPTTYYTTFTYWTTLAKTNGTDLTTISREETHSSIVSPSAIAAPPVFAVNAIEATSLPPSDVIVPTSTKEVETGPSRLLSYEVRKITDAEGISTIQQTTSVILSTINGTETEIVKKSSDVVVNSDKEAPSSSTKYKLGLVRQIEGTQVSDGQTVHYISKIIGTFIDNRYAQIIESTSEFLNIPAEPTKTVSKSIVKSTKAPVIEPTQSEVVEEPETESKVFASKKRTFTPVIRPFASRNRPQFAPKKKLVVPSATVITVLTPTITATPALPDATTSRKFSRNFLSKKSPGFSSSFARKGSSIKSSQHLSSTSPSTVVSPSSSYKPRRPFHNSLSSRKIGATQRLSSTTPAPTATANTTSTTQRSKFYRQRTNLFSGQNKPVDRVRTKRQVYGNFRSRYRSPATTTTSTTPQPTTKRLRGLKRIDSLSTHHTSRTPLTSSSPSRKYSSSTNGRRRLSYNSGSTHNTGSSHNSGSSYSNGNSYKSGSSSSSRSSRQRTGTRVPTKRSRSRTQNLSEYDFVQKDDGKITVTYNIAKQTAIPVVNGHNTEYKNILTASTSTDVVEPTDYTTQIGKNGLITTVLKASSTNVNDALETEITNFVLHEKTTTTVTYTPTTIAGRKTSFSHILPSTIYVVENVVETIRPQIGTNAPLANILLSQLLLGNINANPAFQQIPVPFGTQPPQPFVAGTPVTETMIRTTTYVTTLNDRKSTVVPITFYGKQILTTIYDSSASVVTATEYITETTVKTPTQQPPQQVNSLLLPLLLQQLQNQPQQQQLLQQQLQPQLQLQQNQFADFNGELDNNNISDSFNDQPFDIIDEAEIQEENHHHKRKNKNKHHHQPIQSSSVVTLYVSGKRPGEFSTILSTVVDGSSDYETVGVRRRRELEEQMEENIAKPNFSSILLQTSNDAFAVDDGKSDSFDGIELQTVDHNHKTQSLENVVGNVNTWYHQSDIFTNDYL